MADILIVDDEKILANSLGILFRDEGHQVTTVHGIGEAITRLEHLSPDVALLDLRLPDGSGLEVLRAIRLKHPDAQVVMMTAHGDTATAVESVKLGAVDYINKPFELQEILLIVEQALEQQQLRSEVAFLRRRSQSEGLAEMIGECEPMREICSRIHLVAGAGDSAVLITGESGTGKELAAIALHRLSARRDQPFIEVNCAAIPENLLESELFGFEKGAFTDAQSRKKGLFELADGGTLFLDEIGELPLHLQAKLLRFLEKKSFRRLGGTLDISVDARIIAATNRDLRDEVRKGGFREDLFYRLNVIPIHLPALRTRADDILLLAEHFLAHFSSSLGKPLLKLSPEARIAFTRYRWPGNVRELRNIVERLVILSPCSEIDLALLPQEMWDESNLLDDPPPLSSGFDLESHLQQVELRLVKQALVLSGGHKGHAAQRLGMSRHALKRRLYKLGLAEELNDD